MKDCGTIAFIDKRNDRSSKLTVLIMMIPSSPARKEGKERLEVKGEYARI